MSLALATLLYEWRRYLAAIIALGLSGFLILAFVGLFVGIAEGDTATITRSRADLLVLAPQSESLFGNNAGLARRVQPMIYLNPAVTAVAEMEGDGANWKNRPPPGQKQVSTYVQVWGVGTEPGSVSLPIDYTETQRLALMEPFAAAVDESSLGRLGVKLGDAVTIKGKTVRVRALLHDYASIDGPTVVVSHQTVELLGMASSGDHMGPLLVALKDPSKADQVRDQLNAQAKGLYRAWTRPELAKANQTFLLKNQIIGLILVFAVGVGTFIGVSITWQTLRGAIFANIKEFASLRALGVSVGSLRVIVMELSFWVGVVGLATTAIFVVLITLLAHAASLPMTYPLPITIGVACLLLIIAVASGMLSLGVLKQSQPADLLR